MEGRFFELAFTEKGHVWMELDESVIPDENPDIQGDYYRVSLSRLNLLQDFKVKPILMHTSLKGILLAIFYGWVKFCYCYKFNGYKSTF